MISPGLTPVPSSAWFGRGACAQIGQLAWRAGLK
jgi:hypothetical protein